MSSISCALAVEDKRGLTGKPQVVLVQTSSPFPGSHLLLGLWVRGIGWAQDFKVKSWHSWTKDGICVWGLGGGLENQEKKRGGFKRSGPKALGIQVYVGVSRDQVGFADAEMYAQDLQFLRPPSRGINCVRGVEARAGHHTPAGGAPAGGGDCRRAWHRLDKACARPVLQLVVPPRTAAPFRLLRPVRHTAANGRHRRRFRHCLGSQWW